MRLEITHEEYDIIHSSGLMIDHVYLLQLMNNPIVSELQIGAEVLGMLHLKGYLEKNRLTKGAEDLLARLSNETSPARAALPVPDMIKVFAVDMHAQIQQKLNELTGRKQKVLQEKYSFLCNRIDLEKKLRDFWKQYGAFDMEKVRKLLLAYVGRCHRANWDKVMLVEYYIMKDGTSKLMTDLELSDAQMDMREEQKPLVDPKSMF